MHLNICDIGLHLVHQHVFSNIQLKKPGKSKTCNGMKRNEIETKRNETERNETKRNETKLFRFLF
jgi:hypothetical protein